jgi:ferredoxin-NADP reductase
MGTLITRRDLSPEIWEFTFAAASDTLLAVEAGAHLYVQTPLASAGITVPTQSPSPTV